MYRWYFSMLFSFSANTVTFQYHKILIFGYLPVKIHKISRKEGWTFIKNRSSPREDFGSTSTSTEVLIRVLSKNWWWLFKFCPVIRKWQFLEKNKWSFFNKSSWKNRFFCHKNWTKHFFPKSRHQSLLFFVTILLNLLDPYLVDFPGRRLIFGRVQFWQSSIYCVVDWISNSTLIS